MLKINNRVGYHSVYKHECTANNQLFIRKANADSNMEYWVELKTPEDTTSTNSVRFADSQGFIPVDERIIGEIAFVQYLLTGAKL